jgi:hypothetical protein
MSSLVLGWLRPGRDITPFFNSGLSPSRCSRDKSVQLHLLADWPWGGHALGTSSNRLSSRAACLDPTMWWVANLSNTSPGQLCNWTTVGLSATWFWDYPFGPHLTYSHDKSLHTTIWINAPSWSKQWSTCLPSILALAVPTKIIGTNSLSWYM